MIKLNLTDEQQADIVKHVNDTQSLFSQQLNDYKSRMTYIYDEISTFKQEKDRQGDVDFKVNKAQEVTNKAMSKIIGRPFKWIVSQRRTINEESQDPKLAQAIQDYLTTYFDKSEIKDTIRVWVRGMLNFWVSWCKATYKYRVDRTVLPVKKTVIDEEGNEEEITTQDIKESVVAEYPTGEYRSYTDILFDPRIQNREDHVAVLDVTRNVRLWYILNRRNKFINVDKIVDIMSIGVDVDFESYRNKVEEITWLNYEATSKLELNKLDVVCYQWLYSLKDDNWRGERMYEFLVLGWILLISAKEITEMDYVPLHCFHDTETFISTWLVEPIIGLQKELNFKKKRAAEYINQALYRSWIWSPNSWIDPKRLNQGAGNIIPTVYDAITAQNNLVEIPHRQLPVNYFQEQNDFERQIQALTHTIDTATPRGDNALTQTATWIRIKSFESNAVMAMIRAHVEESVSKLAYKFLKKTFESLDDSENIIINKTDKDWYWRIHKNAMKDAIARYDIKVEAGYSSFDSIEERRSDAIAKYNISKDAKNSGVPVNLEKVFKQVFGTFEGSNVNDIIDQTALLQQQQQQATGKTIRPQDVTTEKQQIPTLPWQ